MTVKRHNNCPARELVSLRATQAAPAQTMPGERWEKKVRSMSAARRVLLAAVAPSVLWVLIVIFKAIWHPSWGDALSDWGAGTSCVLIAVAWVSYPRGVPLLSERRTKRQIAELAKRMSAAETRAQCQQAQMDGLSEGLLQAFAAADREAPGHMAADAATIPHLRRVV